MLDFKKIHIHNFLSIEDTEFEFLPGIHMILGRNQESEYSSSNGSGKSSLIESIPYALYKSSPRDGSFSRRGSSESYLDLYLEVNRVPIRIHRRIIGVDENNSPVSLYVDEQLVNAKGIRRTENDIRSTIGIPYDLFISSIMILQGFPVNLCSLTPTVRKSIIESMLGLVVWEDINKKFVFAKEDRTQLLNSSKQVFDEKKLEMTALNSKIEGLKTMSDQYTASLKEQITELKSRLRDIISQESEIEKELLETTTQTLESLNREAMDLTTESSNLNFEISKLSKSLLQLNCPTCNRPFPKERLDEFKEKKEQYEERLKEINEKLSNVRELVNKVTSLTSKKTELGYSKAPINSQIKQLISAYNSANNKIDIDSLQSQLNDITSEVNSLFKAYKENEEKVSNISVVLSTLLPSSPFRTSLVTKYISVLNTFLKEISKEMFDEIYIEFGPSKEEKGIDIDVLDYRGNKLSYKSLSGGERQRISIITVLAIQKFLMEVSNIETNLIAYDEILDMGLDGVGKDRCLSSINSMFGDNKCVYFISHDESLKSIFQSQIVVNKINGISEIDYSSYIPSI